MARRKAAPPPGYVRRFRDVLATPLGHVLLRAGGVAVLILLGGLVMRQARAEAYAIERFRLTPGSIQLEGLPGWTDAQIAEELVAARHFQGFSASVFDPDAEAAVRAVVTAHPLVRGVDRIDVRFPRSVRVAPVLRYPVAQVTVPIPDGRGGRRAVKRLLGNDGSLLPLAPYTNYRKRLRWPLPIVTGIRATGVERIGAIWEDRRGQVAEAVAAAEVARRLFRDTRGRVHVRGIDVSRFPLRDTDLARAELSYDVVLHPIRRGESRRRFRLEWGRTERDCRDVPREPCYETKLERLRRILNAGRPVRAVVDVRFDGPTS